MGADIVMESLRSKCLGQSFDRSRLVKNICASGQRLCCGRIQEHSLEQCNLAGVMGRKLRCALEENAPLCRPLGARGQESRQMAVF